MHTILIAIDDQAISMLLGEELFGEGYSIRTISDPRELSRVIQRERPNVLLIDEFFGGGRGLDLCLRFRRHLTDTRVVVWSSGISALGGMKHRLPENFHIFKTHALQELTQEICRGLRQPGGQRTQQNSLVGECLLGQEAARRLPLHQRETAGVKKPQNSG